MAPLMTWLRRSNSWYRVDVNFAQDPSEGRRGLDEDGGWEQITSKGFEVTCPWGTLYFGGQVTSWQICQFYYRNAERLRMQILLGIFAKVYHSWGLYYIECAVPIWDLHLVKDHDCCPGICSQICYKSVYKGLGRCGPWWTALYAQLANSES